MSVGGVERHTLVMKITVGHLWRFLGGGDGFLVVSADDVVQPLLGYADVGEFEASDMPDNLRAWLE